MQLYIHKQNGQIAYLMPIHVENCMICSRMHRYFGFLFK